MDKKAPFNKLSRYGKDCKAADTFDIDPVTNGCLDMDICPLSKKTRGEKNFGPGKLLAPESFCKDLSRKCEFPTFAFIRDLVKMSPIKRNIGFYRPIRHVSSLLSRIVEI